jgi:hypothetical protein
MTKYHLAASLLDFKKKKLKFLRGREYIVNGKNVLPTAEDCVDALAQVMLELAPIEPADPDSSQPPAKRPRPTPKRDAFLSEDSDSEASDNESRSQLHHASPELDEIRRSVSFIFAFFSFWSALSFFFVCRKSRIF